MKRGGGRRYYRPEDLEERTKFGFIAKNKEFNILMSMGRSVDPANNHVRSVIPTHSIDSHTNLVGQNRSPSELPTILDDRLGLHDFTAIIISAGTANVMRSFQFSAVRTFTISRRR